jgi:iron-sulfur cluster assembly accessory protein
MSDENYYFRLSDNFDVHITKEAVTYIKNILTTPYLRIGADKGGCSGWLYTLSPEKEAHPDDDFIICIDDSVTIVINKDKANNILKSIKIYLKKLSFGEQLKVEKQGDGIKCGCGDSFA